MGTLKVNVPKSCAGFDENGIPIPGSFDASGLEEEDDDPNAPRVARLIMRQENTHRVILNTIIVRAMKFEDKPSTSTAQIMFTAFEGGEEPKPINMLLKVSLPRVARSCIQLTICRCQRQTPDCSIQRSNRFNMSYEVTTRPRDT